MPFAFATGSPSAFRTFTPCAGPGKMPTAFAFAMPKRGHLVDMLRNDLAAARTAWIAAQLVTKW
ncbi:MAG: hypothetical protein ABSB74_09680 [Tepidisphaeraceae bacterium]